MLARGSSFLLTVGPFEGLGQPPMQHLTEAVKGRVLNDMSVTETLVAFKKYGLEEILK